MLICALRKGFADNLLARMLAIALYFAVGASSGHTKESHSFETFVGNRLVKNIESSANPLKIKA
jgi:hypothetical protein